MAKRRLTEDTPFLRTPDMYQIENLSLIHI